MLRSAVVENSFFCDMMLPQWVMGSRIFEKTHISTHKFKDPTLFRTVGIWLPIARTSCSGRTACWNQNRSWIGSQETKYWWELVPYYPGGRSIDSGIVSGSKFRCNFCVHVFETTWFLNVCTFVCKTNCNNKINNNFFTESIYEIYLFLKHYSRMFSLHSSNSLVLQIKHPTRCNSQS
jgi:hypothetical protein